MAKARTQCHERGEILVDGLYRDKRGALKKQRKAIREPHKDLAGYDTSKGTIRFQADEPLPSTLVRKLVKARLAENMGRRKRAK
jgi:uncharacterized protein YdhG (YjbR/CyaY superfamily)